MTQQDFGRTQTGLGDAAPDAQATADQARREAGSLAQEARGAARDAAEEARRAGSRVKSEAAGIVGTVRDQLAGQAEAQKEGVAARIAAVAGQLHGSAEDLRGRERWLADLLDRGARELDGFADELRQRDVRGLLGGVESLAHRHPALFIGSAVALGFALTRMVRGGAERDDRYPGQSYGSQGYAGGAASQGRNYPGQNYAGSTYPSAAQAPPSTTSTAGPQTGSYVDPTNERPDLGHTAAQMGGTGGGTTGGSPSSSAVASDPTHKRPDLGHTAAQMGGSGSGSGSSSTGSGTGTSPSSDVTGTGAASKGSNI